MTINPQPISTVHSPNYSSLMLAIAVAFTLRLSYGWVKLFRWLQGASVYKWKSVIFLLLASHNLYSVRAISSDSSSQIDVDAFLNLPPSEHMLTYPNSNIAQDETEINSHPRTSKTQQHGNHEVLSDQDAERKQIIYLRNKKYRKTINDDPIRRQKMRDFRKASREKKTANFSAEELEKYNLVKRERERVLYQIRKQKSGFGTKQNQRMKHLREKVNANTATPEETVEFEKVVEQKRKSSQAIRLRSKQSKKKG